MNQLVQPKRKTAVGRGSRPHRAATGVSRCCRAAFVYLHIGKEGTVAELKLTLPDKSGRDHTFRLMRCGPADAARIMALQEEVLSGMEDRTLFARTSEEELAESLREDWCLAVLDGEEMAAFTLMVVNRVSPRSAGTYLGYDEAQLLKCVTYDTTFVHPRFRGLGLQRELGRLKDEAAFALGAAEALATVSPENGPSLQNILLRGFEICGDQLLYSGVRRYIMRKKL